jgi:hypothetical protein
MAAPLIIAPAVLAVLLGGAPLAPWIADTGTAITIVDGVTVDLAKLCLVTDPLLDALADRPGGARWLTIVTHAADRVCAAAAAGPGAAQDIGLVIAALQAIHSAKAELSADTTVAPTPGSSAHSPARR